MLRFCSTLLSIALYCPPLFLLFAPRLPDLTLFPLRFSRTKEEVTAKFKYMTLMEVRSACTKKGVSTFGTKEAMIDRLVAKEKPISGWPTKASSSSPARSSGITESSVKSKYTAMTLMELRRACTQKGLSQMGTKDQLIAKLVLKEKPPGGCGNSSASSSSSSSYSSATRSGPTEASVKNKYLAMTLMELRRACTQKGLSQIGVKDDLIRKLVAKEKPAAGWGTGASSPARSYTTSYGASAGGSGRRQYTIKLAAKVCGF